MQKLVFAQNVRHLTQLDGDFFYAAITLTEENTIFTEGACNLGLDAILFQLRDAGTKAITESASWGYPAEKD